MSEISRRNLLGGVPFLAAAALPFAPTISPSVGKSVLLEYTVNVGSMPSPRAKEFLERTLDRLKEGRPDNWVSILLPARSGPLYSARVFILDDRGERQEIEAFLERQALIHKVEAWDDLYDYACTLAGAPVAELSEEVSTFIEDLVNETFSYNIGDKRHYICDCLCEAVHVGQDGIARLDENAGLRSGFTYEESDD